MTVKEYNKDFHPAYSKALSFLNCLDHALQKSDENACMQCAVIGWDEGTKAFLIKALHSYQENTKRNVMAQIDKN